LRRRGNVYPRRLDPPQLVPAVRTVGRVLTILGTAVLKEAAPLSGRRLKKL
jgi:hypothetical protein